MNLLIKIYLKDINPYDVLSIVDDFNLKITDKNTTKVSIVLDSKYQKEFTDYKFYFTTETSIPKLINTNFEGYKWDIVLPIITPRVPIDGFDTRIKETYEKNYPNLNGVLWLNDGEQAGVCTLPVIGKKYYTLFRYIYNPSYEHKNFQEEFTEVMKIKHSFVYVDDLLFDKKKIITDDDNIYNFRKKLTFCALFDESAVEEETAIEIPAVPVTEEPEPTQQSPPPPKTAEETTKKEEPPKPKPVPPKPHLTTHPNPKHPTVRFRRKFLNH